MLRVLQDCPLTNAGYGSNLTRGGDPHPATSQPQPGGVECDASIMAGSGTLSSRPVFGAVGAAPGA
jgi:isoaspartyl peptidase/L-asparaginase-like protein (Ntn-hydrolase superfamily)